MTRSFTAIATVIAIALTPTRGLARVTRIEIDSREDILAGQVFGSVGAYEKIIGRVYFAFDPANRMNSRIVDLDRASINEQGLVEAWADFVVLRPKRPVAGGGIGLLEVSNRGGKASLRYFNGGGRTLDPATAEDFGDGLLMRLGLTVIWIGWQHDVPIREGLLRLHVPTAFDNGAHITGLVRSDWTLDTATQTLAIGHRANVAYPVADPNDPENVLTVRDGRMAPRRTVPRDEWRFARGGESGVIDDRTHIYKETGFEAGKIYELVYRAQDPRMVGLGLAAIRDMMSYAKYDARSPFPVEHGIAIGISQTGRFLRHFVYQGFNTDEGGRMVFDGLMIHTAGAGRGSFNHRFGQPSRDAHRYSAFFFPTDIFPFSARTQTDVVTEWTDGLFAHAFYPEHLPKIFYTNTGYEYWGRAASLIHTTVDGKGDIELFPNERVYHLASGQHFVGGFPPPDDAFLAGGAYRGNPLNFLPVLRALLIRMAEWVTTGTEPPPSAYPRIDDATLVTIADVKFPQLPGVTLPSVVHEAYRANYGPRWSLGIVDRQPPTLGPAYPSLVPQVDEFGNELGGLRTVEIQAPLATYAPWNLRTGYPGGTSEMTDFLGTYVPLSRTEAQRMETGDPRPSIESLYHDHETYLDVVRRAAVELVEAGTLLEEDIDVVVERAGRNWDWIHQN